MQKIGKMIRDINSYNPRDQPVNYIGIDMINYGCSVTSDSNRFCYHWNKACQGIYLFAGVYDILKDQYLYRLRNCLRNSTSIIVNSSRFSDSCL